MPVTVLGLGLLDCKYLLQGAYTVVKEKNTKTSTVAALGDMCCAGRGTTTSQDLRER